MVLRTLEKKCVTLTGASLNQFKQNLSSYASFTKRKIERRMMFKSSLYDERAFYQAFSQDLLRAEREVVIESPFITRSRMKEVFPLFQKLVNRGVKVFVMTRNPSEHMEVMGLNSSNRYGDLRMRWVSSSLKRKFRVVTKIKTIVVVNSTEPNNDQGIAAITEVKKSWSVVKKRSMP